MKPQDISKIGKIITSKQEPKIKKKEEKSNVSFSDVFEKELLKKKEKVKSVSHTIPVKKLLNIKQKPTEDIFVKKAFSLYNDIINSLDKYKTILENKELDTNKAKNSIKELQNLLDKLNLIIPEISNQNIKNDLLKAIIVGNVEIEKYIKESI